MKKIPNKNYVILVAIVLATVFLTFYVRGWYITSSEVSSSESVLADAVKSINKDEIGNYIIENQKFILYVSSNDAEVKNFERRFKRVIKKYDIIDDVIYLNVNNAGEDFYDYLRGNFSLNAKVGSEINPSQSSIYVFLEGKVSAVLNDVHNLSMSKVESFLKKWGFKNA